MTPRHRTTVTTFIAVTLSAFLALSAFAQFAHAHETDQFTTPAGREFADLGMFFNQWAYDLLDAGVRRANARIAQCLRDGDPARIANAQDAGNLVNAIHEDLPWSVHQIEAFEHMLMSDEMRLRYPGLIVSYRELDHNIYEHAFSALDLRIFSRLFFASTIKVDGVYLGTDKIGHFTELGVSYYWSWHEARKAGASEEQAVAAAVRNGTEGLMSEAGLLGTVANGDYANGDLSANFAGFLFYRNTAGPVWIKGTLQPPMVVREGPFWRLADHVRRDRNFFSIFISDHLDEALNPGFFDESMRPALREAVRRNARAILWRYRSPDGTTRPRSYFEQKLRELSTFGGIDYGHRGTPNELVSIANCCFGNTPEVARDNPVLRDAAPLLDDGDARTASDVSPPLFSHSSRTVRFTNQPPTEDASLDNGDGGAFHIGALHRAASRDDLPTLFRLLDRDPAAVLARDDLGRTPLHAAAAAGSTRSARLLLARKVPPDAADDYGTTALHLACRNGHLDVARELVRAGANVNAANRAGSTPLHEAAMVGDHRLIEFLLGAGANPKAADHLGRTPGDVARQHQNRRVELALEESARP